MPDVAVGEVGEVHASVLHDAIAPYSDELASDLAVCAPPYPHRLTHRTRGRAHPLERMADGAFDGTLEESAGPMHLVGTTGITPRTAGRDGPSRS